jgi:hypothetical protein
MEENSWINLKIELEIICNLACLPNGVLSAWFSP